MTKTSPSLDTRGFLLKSLASKPQSGALPEGVYDPIRNERRLALLGDPSSQLAVMVSLHEASHSFLNASTTYGNAMILMGVLASINGGAFDAAVARMIDDCVDTHETYATTTALQLVANGRDKMTMLAGYPDYHKYLQAFVDRFDGGARPEISVIAVRACARAAMQSSVYDFFHAEPCANWSAYKPLIHDAPDERFSVFEDASAAMEIVDAGAAAARESAEPWSRLAHSKMTDEEWAAAIAADRASLDEIEHRTFEAAAARLRKGGFEVQGFDAQRRGLETLISKMRATYGDAPIPIFHTPSKASEDDKAVLSDYRSEHLFLSAEKLSAHIHALEDPDAPDPTAFIYRNGDQRHVQLIAMPAKKAGALYEVRKGGEILARTVDGVITGLRRLIRTEGDAPRADILLLAPDRLYAFVQANAPLAVHALASLVAIRDEAWRDEWVSEEQGVTNALFVLIDDDPFEHLDHLCRRASRVELIRFGGAFEGAEYPHPMNVTAFGLIADDEPDMLYFTPCSHPLQLAITQYAKEKHSNISISTRFPDRWRDAMQRIFIHVVQEEQRFGPAFWV